MYNGAQTTGYCCKTYKNNQVSRGICWVYHRAFFCQLMLGMQYYVPFSNTGTGCTKAELITGLAELVDEE